MEIIEIIFTIFCAYKILREKDNVNVLLYFLVIPFCVYNLTIMGTLTTYRLIAFVAFLKCCMTKSIRISKSYPLTILLILIFINYCLIGFLDTRHDGFTMVGRVIFRYVTTFGIVLFGFLSVTTEDDFKRLLINVYKLSCWVFVYTFFVFLIKFDPIGNALGEPDFLNYGGRLRVPSLMGFGVNGFVGALIGVMTFYNPYNLLKANKRWVLFVASLLTVVLCGFRIQLIIFIVGLFILILFSYRKQVKTILVGIAIFITAYTFVPYVNRLVNQTVLTVFTDDQSDIEGSNKSMRDLQYNVAYTYFLKHPYWGYGFSYFSENIGTKGDVYNGGLMGAEGYYILMLIEEGGVQIVLSTLFFLLSLLLFLRNIFKNNISLIGVALISMFWVYCIGTRPDNTWFYIMPFIGCITRIIKISNSKQKNK